MRAALESLCCMCILSAMAEQMHMGSRHFSVLRFIIGMRLILLLVEIIENLI